jgi:membrane protease YdiL (CAAX protease family)
MSTTRKSVIFLALTFALSWAAAIGGWALGAAEQPLALFASLLLMMAGPAIAATICVFAFEKGRRVVALGLRFKPYWWWLIAYLAAPALCVLSVLLTVLLSDRTLGDLGANALLAAQQAGADVSSLPQGDIIVALILLQALVVGALINSFMLTFTEELGWRGYLHDLWRKHGFWRSSLGTGFIWGVWHAPAIYLLGHNYPDDRLVGVVLFVLFCTLLSPLMTLVRDRGGSTFAAGILHGTLNAAAGLSILGLSSPDFPWNGILGIGGYAALAISVAVVALLQMRTPAPAVRPAAS